MTILDALTAAIQVPGIDNNTLEKACVDADLESSNEYAKSDSSAVDMAAVSVLKSLVIASESEGGFSYAISANMLRARIAELESKLGLAESSIPKIRNANVW